MPVATLVPSTERHDLKSLPEGFVVLRRMSYGERLKRENLIMQMQMQAAERGKDPSMVVDMTNERLVAFEFATCIVDHNLTDERDRKLNLSASKDFTALDPRIGDEISDLIKEMHDYEEDLGDSGNSDEPSDESSSEMATSQE